jgi:class 3 adenylate cyclase/ActR/RegA family two-component response regulator
MRVLLLQSEQQTMKNLNRFFKDRGDKIFSTSDLNQGTNALAQTHPHLLVLDMHFASSTWISFLRKTRQNYPDLKIILTNKYPDLQREMQAKELGIFTFLRQPYTQRWMEKALREVFNTATVGAKTAPHLLTLPQVRLPVRIKITLPYLVLATLFALIVAFVVSQVVLESIRNRFLDQLVQTGRQCADWMVQEEDRLLSTLRLITNSSGMGELVIAQDAEGLRERILPLAINAGEEEIVLLDMQGVSLLSMRQLEGQGNYEYVRGETSFQQYEFIQKTIQNQVDIAGDKYSGVVYLPRGSLFYVSGPLFDTYGIQVGVVLVGKSLTTLVKDMGQATQANVTLYHPSGQIVASTLFTDLESQPLDQGTVDNVIATQQENSQFREFQAIGLDYMEVLGPWEARHGGDMGLLGVSLQQTYLLQTSRETRITILILVAVAVLGVILLGLFLAGKITRPLARLVRASNEVAQGNFEVKVDSRGDDELAVLAQSFNYMVAGLQEGSIYRDLLGRAVSPEVREQLRHTFTSGNVRLEGQEAVATVIMTDIRDFTTLAEHAEPSTVLGWLNEYFSKLVPIINTYGGVVNKFDGDAMLAFFGILPRKLNPKQGAFNACMAALEMTVVINQLNQERLEHGEPPMVTGFGINTGVVIAGGLGSSDRLHYTIIGDTVNTTQRLETLTRTISDDTSIVISQMTYNALAEQRFSFVVEPIGSYALKGKSEQVMAYRLFALAEKGMGGGDGKQE